MSLPALGSATRFASIMDERMPWGGPRFYPPGEHPATYRMREHRRKLLEVMDAHPMMAFTAPDAYRNGVEMLSYLDQKLAEFEAGEDEAKRRAWLRFHDRSGANREQPQ